MEKQIMTTKEAAAYTGLTISEIRRLTDARILKPLRGFRSPKKFSRHVIDMWLRGQERLK